MTCPAPTTDGQKQRFPHDERGTASIEMAFLSGMMLLLTAGAVEAGYAYHQHSSAQHAVRHGARVAATIAPVASALDGASGTFDVTCSGRTNTCSTGGFSAAQFTRLIEGVDDDGTCAATTPTRRGMCDLIPELDADTVSVRYAKVGAADPLVVSVTVERRALRTVVIGPLLPGRFKTLPPTTATLAGGDFSG